MYLPTYLDLTQDIQTREIQNEKASQVKSNDEFNCNLLISFIFKSPKPFTNPLLTSSDHHPAV